MFIRQVKCTGEGRCWRDEPEVVNVVLCGKLDVGTFDKIPDPLIAIPLQRNCSHTICIRHLVLVLADTGDVGRDKGFLAIHFLCVLAPGDGYQHTQVKVPQKVDVKNKVNWKVTYHCLTSQHLIVVLRYLWVPISRDNNFVLVYNFGHWNLLPFAIVVIIVVGNVVGVVINDFYGVPTIAAFTVGLVTISAKATLAATSALMREFSSAS